MLAQLPRASSVSPGASRASPGPSTSSCQPGASPRHRSPKPATPMRLLQRILSTGSLSARECTADAAGNVPSPSRLPLQPLAVPPSIDSPASFGSEASEDELPPHYHFSKRQRLSVGGTASRGSVLSPLARSAIARAPSPAAAGFRPPPIRTMTSLEGPLGGSPTPAPIVTAPALGDEVVPPTPTVGRFGSGGFRSFHRQSRLSVPPMSMVAPRLFVGDEVSASSLPRLVENGVTHVLNCTSKPNPVLEGPSSGLGYLRLDLMDNTGDLPRMQGALRAGVDFIRAAIDQGGVVLVHCHRGISRSCTLALAYLVESLQRPAEVVFEQLRAARRIVDPNLGYWCAIHEWERLVLPAVLVRPRSRALATPSPRPLSRAG